MRLRALVLAPLLLPPLFALTACGGSQSPPIIYYSLAGTRDVAPGPVTAPFIVALSGIDVPSEEDQPQMVVQTAQTAVTQLDQQRWSGPLADQIGTLLLQRLGDRLHATTIRGTPPDGHPAYRIGVDVRHFDMAPGQFAAVDAVWTLTTPGGGAPLICESLAREPAGAGMPALVEGGRRAVASIGDKIADTIAAIGSGRRASCPPA
jgi:uncharacterized lipoprotein YmbA